MTFDDYYSRTGARTASVRGDPTEPEPTVEVARQDAVERAAGGLGLAVVSGYLVVSGPRAGPE